LVTVLDQLRSPGGCPWDAEQTHQSLVEYLIEEAYESVEAIDANDREAMREELGDLLLQVVFHARISQEQPNGWDIDDVIDGITQKLIRRHPLVFADEQMDTADAVELTWHERKTREKRRSSVTEGIPDALPALMRAEKLVSRSKSVLVPDPEYLSQTNKLLEQFSTEEQFNTEEQLGDYLFALVNSANLRGLDTEAAVRKAVLRRMQEVRSHE
jgi:XTP/dITP diphosphohydrolase